MSTDWILRVGDGGNFIRSSKYNIWGIQTTTSPHGKYFISTAKPGDRLWFVKNKSKGKIIAVATYKSYNNRVLGPLINITMSNEELGWEESSDPRINWTSNIEIHYENFYNLTEFDLLSHIKGPSPIRKDSEKIPLDLPTEYKYIVRYSKVTRNT